LVEGIGKMSETLNADQDASPEPASLTPDDIEMLFHTANMLGIAADLLSSLTRHPQCDTNVLIAKAAEMAIMDVVLDATSEAEFTALQDKYYGAGDDDDDIPAETHAGTETVQ
jgi:hypothetical protein